MDGFLQDLRVALRSLLRGGATPLLAVLCLGLGIGLNTAVFAIVHGVLLRELPFEDANRVVAVQAASPSRGVEGEEVTFADLAALRETGAFTAVEAVQERTFTLTGGEASERVQGSGVTPGLFPMLGVEPRLGRGFRPEEGAEPGFEPVVLLSDALWQRRFAGDPAAVGSTLHVNGRDLVVVGVMPPGFRFPEIDDLWVPLAPADWTDGARRAVAAVGRLAAGVSLDDARARAADVEARMASQREETHAGWELDVRPLRDTMVNAWTRRSLQLLLGAVGFVLLIACVDVANLLLARSSERHREVAVRAALGATRWRMIRQLLTEALVLSLAGAGAGVLLATWFVDASLARIPEDLAYWMSFEIDGAVLAYTAALTVGTAVLFGTLPALRASRPDLARRMGGRSGVADRALSTLVGVEVALSLVLLVGAGLMVRSFLGVVKADIGVPVASTLSLRVVLAGDRYDPVEERIRFFEEAAARLGERPGVAGAAAMSSIPADDGGPTVRARSGEDRPLDDAPLATLVGSTAGAFAALGVPLRAGREFTAAEARDTAAAVALVGESLAARLWGSEDAVGRTLFVESEPLRVIGIVPDIAYEELTEARDASRLQVHVPYAALGWRGMALLVRGRGEAPPAAADVRAVLRGLDADQAPFDVMSMTQRRRFTSWPERFFGGLFAQLGAIALLLAGAGVYGVVAYGVSRRRRELGLRLALGAPRRTVLGGVVRTSLVPVALGTLAGTAGALAVGRLLSSLLYGVGASDPVTLGVAAGVMLVVATAAVALPARRALALDPAESLRVE